METSMYTCIWVCLIVRKNCLTCIYDFADYKRVSSVGHGVVLSHNLCDSYSHKQNITCTVTVIHFDLCNLTSIHFTAL